MPELVSLAGVSGGKDSTALVLHMLEFGVPFEGVFADTGNEHPWTVDFVQELSHRTGIKIHMVKAEFTDAEFAKKRDFIRNTWPKQGVPDHICERAHKWTFSEGNPFLDICILRSGFPAAKGRFCTDRLKIRPIHEQVFQSIWDRGDIVLNWQGIRREESPARAAMDPFQRLIGKGEGEYWAVRPLLDWTLNDVWRMHKRHGINPNNLYKYHQTRVGCMDCIFATKQDIATTAEFFPEHIDKIERWERRVGLVTKRDPPEATFFPAKNLPEFAKLLRDWKADGHWELDGVAVDRDDFEDTTDEWEQCIWVPSGAPKPIADQRIYGIRAQVDWAKTTRGGRQYDLLPLTEIIPDMSEDCGSWGVCE